MNHVSVIPVTWLWDKRTQNKTIKKEKKIDFVELVNSVPRILMPGIFNFAFEDVYSD